jgi:hypothetical protein
MPEAIMSIFATLDHLAGIGEKEGKERGVREGTCQQLGKLLLRHGKRSLGSPSDEERILVNTLGDRLALARLEEMLDRFLAVSSWADLLAGISPPAERPADPAYLLPYEFDPSPTTDSIDEYARVTLVSGEQAVVHLRLQKRYQDNIGVLLYKDSQRLKLQYNSLVHTVVLLLWTGADGPNMTGEYQIPGGGVFHYHLTRLWEKDVDEMFEGLGTISLTPLAKFAPERLPEVVRRMEEVIETKAKGDTKDKLWFLAYSSMGLRYPPEQVNQMLAHKMAYFYEIKEFRRVLSDGYYQGQSEGQPQGQIEGTKHWVITLGKRRLGEPSAEVRQALDAVQSLDRLEQLAARVLKGASWQEVLLPG